MAKCDVYLYNANKKKYVFKKTFKEYIDSLKLLRTFDPEMTLEEVVNNEQGEWFKFSSSKYNSTYLLPEEFTSMFIHVHN